MSLESSNHGLEGISNGGEIYGGYNLLDDDMIAQADEINAMLDKINIEENIQEEYLKTVESLALKKLKNDILFEEMVNTSISELSNLGIEISKEHLMDDIQKEIAKQSVDLGINESIETSKKENVTSQIEYLKNNLDQIFGEGSTMTSTEQSEGKIR